MVNLTAIGRWLTATDEGTWVGHGMLGLLYGCMAFIQPGYGVVAVLFTFGHREADDYYNKGGSLRDGFMDMWSPVVAAMLMELVAGVT